MPRKNKIQVLGWTIWSRYTLGVETWYVERLGTVVATYMSKAAAVDMIKRAMGVLR